MSIAEHIANVDLNNTPACEAAIALMAPYKTLPVTITDKNGRTKTIYLQDPRFQFCEYYNELNAGELEATFERAVR